MATATLLLTSYNLPRNTSPTEFDAWCDYVEAHIAERTGFPVEVDRTAFGSGIVQDHITCGTGDERQTLREAVAALWEAWCSAGPVAPGMADIRSCVVCGKALKADRAHVDTCGARCYGRLLAKQRAAL